MPLDLYEKIQKKTHHVQILLANTRTTSMLSVTTNVELFNIFH